MLLAPARRLLDALSADVLTPFLADWPADAKPRECGPSTLPVLRYLTPSTLRAVTPTAELVDAVLRDAPSLAWRQTYTAADLPATFLDRYGWMELIGQRGPVASDRIACGFLLLGPDTHYPAHRHDAEEIYIPLAGRRVPPGELVHHPPRMPHAMRTDADALLALYLWRGGDLAQKSVFSPEIPSA
jgi:hypothetical protein